MTTIMPKLPDTPEEYLAAQDPKEWFGVVTVVDPSKTIFTKVPNTVSYLNVLVAESPKKPSAIKILWDWVRGT